LPNDGSYVLILATRKLPSCQNFLLLEKAEVDRLEALSQGPSPEIIKTLADLQAELSQLKRDEEKQNQQLINVSCELYDCRSAECDQEAMNSQLVLVTCQLAQSRTEVQTLRSQAGEASNKAIRDKIIENSVGAESPSLSVELPNSRNPNARNKSGAGSPHQAEVAALQQDVEMLKGMLRDQRSAPTGSKSATTLNSGGPKQKSDSPGSMTADHASRAQHHEVYADDADDEEGEEEEDDDEWNADDED